MRLSPWRLRSPVSEAKPPAPAVYAARLLQASVPVAEAFAAPFFTRLDPGEGDPLRSPVVSAPHGAH
jgi:hypothetical protein